MKIETINRKTKLSKVKIKKLDEC